MDRRDEGDATWKRGEQREVNADGSEGEKREERGKTIKKTDVMARRGGA